MLLTLIFTFRAGPVLLVDILSHFLMIVWEKKIKNMFFEYICKNYYVAQDLTDDPVSQSVAQQILPSW